jgi:hypothetical protein
VVVVEHLTAVQQAAAVQAAVARVEQVAQSAERPHSTAEVAADQEILIQVRQKLAALVLTEWPLSAMLARYNVAQAAQ